MIQFLAIGGSLTHCAFSGELDTIVGVMGGIPLNEIVTYLQYASVVTTIASAIQYSAGESVMGDSGNPKV